MFPAPILSERKSGMGGIPAARNQGKSTAGTDDIPVVRKSEQKLLRRHLEQGKVFPLF